MVQDKEYNDDDLIVCRCEEVTLGEIKKAIADGASDMDAVKRFTRAGMGLCQCKSCYNLTAKIIAKETGKKMSEITPFTSRPPVRPVPVRCWSAASRNK